MLEKQVKPVRALLSKARKTWFAHYLRALPVQKNTVFYHAYRNRIMSCNPYAIFVEMINDPEFSHFHHYWVYDSEESMQYDTFRRHANLPNVHYVKASTPKHLRAMATCEYLINNAAMPDYWMKKAGQTYINTWHGTPLKMLGKHAKDFKESSVVNARRNFLLADYLVMPNRYTIEKILDSYDVAGLTNGVILDAGYPRNDLPLMTDRNRIIKLLENKTGESLENKKIVLYAPTFRSENGISLDTSDEAIGYIQEMMATLPENYTLFFKIHNTLGKFFRNNQTVSKRLIFDEIDTNELLAATDVLITDYSSIFFDYLATKRPCLFFVYDRLDYETNRGVYLDIDTMPGALCYTVADIIKNLNLISTNEYNYLAKEQHYREEFAYNDDGNASKRVVDVIFRKAPISDQYIYQDITDIKNIIINCGENFNKKKMELLRYYLHTMSERDYRYFLLGNNLPDIQQLDEFADIVIKNMDTEILLQGRLGSNVYEYVNLSVDEDKKVSRYKTNPNTFCSAIYYFKDVEAFIQDYEKHDSPNRYEKISLVCTSEREVAATRKMGFQPIHQNDFERLVGKHLTFLFVSGTDSMNYTYVECIKQMRSKGHNVFVVIQNEWDEINNKPFLLSGISTTPIRLFDYQILDMVDVAIVSPVLYNAYKRLYAGLRARSILIAAFSNLFSSVAMRIYPDILFTLGENKHNELIQSHLRYNTIFIGNPQYDPLVRTRRETNQAEIKKVIIIDQGGYPYGENGKTQLAGMLVHIAKNNPDIFFDIKPRYGIEEKGIVHHSVSEQLADFILDPPDNLTILRNNMILEEAITNYDAMISTWSTAFMAAATLNIPILLVDGLDSHDVFDVRLQRVSEAYNHLKNTGCVKHFYDIMNEPLEFKYIDKEFLDKEIYHNCEESAPKVVDFLEHYYYNISSRNLAFTSDLELGVDEYYETWEKLEKRPADDQYIKEHLYRERLNHLMQEAVYTNRCMANVMNLAPLESFYDQERIQNYTRLFGDDMSHLINDFNDKLSGIKTEYFNNAMNQSRLESDIILQDYYLDWLYSKRNTKELFNPSIHISAVSSLEYNKALVLLKKNKKQAFYHLNQYLRLLPEQSSPQVLLKEKRVSSYTMPFRKGLNKPFFFYYLLKYKNMKAISHFPENMTRRNPILSYLLMLENNRQGLFDKTMEIYEAYMASSDNQKNIKMRNKKSKLHIKKLIRALIKKSFQLMMTKEYTIAQKSAV